MKNTEELKQDNQIVKSNKMVEAKYRLTVWEQRIILTLCSKISSTDNAFNEFSLTVNEFCEFLGIKNDDYQVNKVLKKKCKELQSKVLLIDTNTKKGKREWTIFNWFHHIKYSEGEGKIYMQFHEYLEPYLLEMKDRYTKYKLGYVLNFKSEFSFRLYELLKQYETIGGRTLLLEEIREYLNIEEKEAYKKYSHLKARIIQKAVSEINEYSDITVKTFEIKKGKKVEAIEFEIRKKDNLQTPLEEWQYYSELKEKSKNELGKILNSIISKKYNIVFTTGNNKIICKEAILQLVMELKNGDFEDTEIKTTPILYFQGVLIKKHNTITGEEITKADLRRAEIEEISKEIG